jgi:hypothetical protein
MPTVPVFSPVAQTTRARQSFRPIQVFFLPYGRGFSGKNGFLKGATPTVNQGATLLCTLESLSDIGLSAVGEEVVSMPGKIDRTTLPDSIASAFTMPLNGGAVGTLKYILGISPHLGTALEWSLYNFQTVGAIIVHKYDNDSKLPVSSLLIPNVKLKVENVAGVPDSGTSSQTLSFYQDDAEIYQVVGNQQWTYSLFHDNGASVVNSAAPNTSTTPTTFALDDCNNSATTTPPQPLLVFPNRTGYKQYLAVCRADTVVPTTSQATFATATVTFGTAPVAGTSLLFIYAIDTSAYDAPMYHSNTGGMLVLSEDFMGIL